MTEAADGLEGEAALIGMVWSSAPALSLAHDGVVDDLERALVEAALWSGIGADVELPSLEDSRGRVIVAAPRPSDIPGGRIYELGVAGGDVLLGEPLSELRRVWEDGV
jgi:hypothetical protein